MRVPGAEAEQLKEEACEQSRCKKELVVVSQATHLFEEPGTLEEVARAWRQLGFGSI